MPKLCRRRVLAMLMVLASVALAQGGQGSLDTPRARSDQEHKRQSLKNEDGESEHTLYAQVNLAKNGVVGLSTGRLETTSPWARYLAPGMWIRARGEWEHGVFQAQSLEVAQPAFFSYYKGPAAPLGLGGGWVEIWHSSDSAGGNMRRLVVRPATSSGEVILLVRSLSGRLIALPAGLPPITNLTQGWMLVKGVSDANRVRWTGVQRFP